MVEELGEVARPGSGAGRAVPCAPEAPMLKRGSRAPSAACVPSACARLVLDQVPPAASGRCQRYGADGAAPRLGSPEGARRAALAAGDAVRVGV